MGCVEERCFQWIFNSDQDQEDRPAARASAREQEEPSSARPKGRSHQHVIAEGPRQTLRWYQRLARRWTSYTVSAIVNASSIVSIIHGLSMTSSRSGPYTCHHHFLSHVARALWRRHAVHLLHTQQVTVLRLATKSSSADVASVAPAVVRQVTEAKGLGRMGIVRPIERCWSRPMINVGPPSITCQAHWP